MNARSIASAVVILVATGAAGGGFTFEPFPGPGVWEPVEEAPGENWYAPLYIRSDSAGAGAASPGAPAFGLDHDGVGQLSISRPDLGGAVSCTASLLWTGRHLLTAAHCLIDDSGAFAASAASMTWQTPSGAFASAAVSATFPADAGGRLYDGEVLHGWDVAILELADPVGPAVPRYDIFRGGGASELGRQAVKVGYGRGGLGSTGATLSAGTKRVGLNRWESTGLGALGVGGITNNDTQLTYDFDSGSSDNDAFEVFFGFAGDLGFGEDEVGAAPGDSGGPTFVLEDGRYQIAGVTSYGLRLGGASALQSDVDSILNSSWGEFGGDTRVAQSVISAFVDEIVPPVLWLPGDANGDGFVGDSDYTIWADNYLAYPATWEMGDFNGDRVVNDADYTIWADNYTGGAPAGVPEPSALAAMMLPVPLLLARRLRRTATRPRQPS
jgi:hypothetical protein